jgi:Tfp pilus assembly protein PilV
MSAGELAVLIAAVLCSIGFTALIVVLLRVLDATRTLRNEVTTMRHETGQLLVELRASTDDARVAIDEARDDLDRFDRVLGSAEAISGAVVGGTRVARVALSTPMIKTAALATGTTRAVRRFRRKERRSA